MLEPNIDHNYIFWSRLEENKIFFPTSTVCTFFCDFSFFRIGSGAWRLPTLHTSGGGVFGPQRMGFILLYGI